MSTHITPKVRGFLAAHIVSDSARLIIGDQAADCLRSEIVLAVQDLPDDATGEQVKAAFRTARDRIVANHEAEIRRN